MHGGIPYKRIFGVRVACDPKLPSRFGFHRMCIGCVGWVGPRYEFWSGGRVLFVVFGRFGLGTLDGRIGVQRYLRRGFGWR